MRTYLRLTNRTFYEDWYGKVKNIPNAKTRNFYLKRFSPNQFIEVQIPSLKSRTTVKNKWKKNVIV